MTVAQDALGHRNLFPVTHPRDYFKIHSSLDTGDALCKPQDVNLKQKIGGYWVMNNDRLLMSS